MCVCTRAGLSEGVRVSVSVSEGVRVSTFARVSTCECVCECVRARV